MAAALVVVPTGTSTAAVPQTPQALDSVASCVRSQGNLALEVLVDESGSLKRTDPNADRATAVGAAVRNLAGLAAAGAKVQLQLSVFSTEHRVLVPFGELDAGSEDRFVRAAQRLAALNQGIDTDFAAALTAARAALASRPERCRVLLLFTDGNYDVQPGAARKAKSFAPGIRPTDRASADRLEKRGRDLLCRREGTTDQMRVDGATLLVVPLTTGISSADQGFLQAVATGHGSGGAVCGARGTPETGAYLPAGGFGSLLDVFDDLTAQLAGGTKLPDSGSVRACEGKACPSGRLSFRIDPGIRRFHVLVDLGAPGLEVQLAPPKVRPVILRFGAPGTNSVGGVRLSHVWLSPTALGADVTLPADGTGIGRWTATVVDRTGGRAGSLAKLAVHVYGDLGAALLSEPRVIIGEPANLSIGLVDGQGSPLTPGSLVRRVQITVQVTDPGTGRTTELGRVEPDRRGRARVTYDVPQDLAAGSVTLSLTTTVTTPSGLVLSPTTSRSALAVRPPADFPTVTPAILRLPAIEGTNAQTADIVVRGGTTSAGCLWVAGVTTDALPPAGRRLVTTFTPKAESLTTCLRVKASEVRTLRLRLVPEHAASGPVTFAVKLRLVSDTSPEELTHSVPVRTELLLPVQQGRRLLLFVLLLVLGLACPFLVLHVANAMSARFAGLEFLRFARIPVRLEPDDVLSRLEAPGRLLTADTGEFRNVRKEVPRPTKVVVDDDLVIRRVLPRLPVGIPYAEVEAAGRPVVSSAGHTWRRDGCRGRLTLQVAGDWVFVLHGATEQGALKGDLYLFIGDTVTGARPDEVIDRASRGAAFMRALVRDAAAHAPKPPEAGRLPAEQPVGRPEQSLSASPADEWSQPLSSAGPGSRHPENLPPPPTF